MGGAVSSGESNDDLIDNLLEADYIKSPLVERVFRAVDRGLYYTLPHKMNAYKDLAWKDGNLHLSAPCIYSEVMENLQLEPGMSFLNIGSGTGYLSTICGLVIGRGGVNHGIELYSDVVDYAKGKLLEFLSSSAAIDMFDFCAPEFVVGNCLHPILCKQRYDRIYCGAACPDESIRSIVELLKVGGICVIPVSDSLMQIKRLSDDLDERKSLLPVSFATLISPKNGTPKKPVQLPDWNPSPLMDLCRGEIRAVIRSTILPPETRRPGEEGRKKRRRRRQERRRASRLLVVQRRRGEGEETGLVAVAYSVGDNSSEEDEGDGRAGGRNDESHSEEEEIEFDLPDLDEVIMELDHNDADNEPNHSPPNEPQPSIGQGPSNQSRHSAGYSNSSSPFVSGSGNQRDNSLQTPRPDASTNQNNQTNNRARARPSIIPPSEGILGHIREMYRRSQPDRISSRAAAAIRSVVSNSNSLERLSSISPINRTGTWSTDSSLDSSSSSITSTSEDDRAPAPTSGNTNTTSVGTDRPVDESLLMNNSNESGVELDINNRNVLSLQPDENISSTKTNNKKQNFSNQMKGKINELMLPPSIKIYLNYNRQF